MFRVFSRYLGFRKMGLVVLENFLLVCCVLMAGYLRLGSPLTAGDRRPGFLLRAFLIAIVFQLFLHSRDIYQYPRIQSFLQLLSRLGQAITMASGALAIFFYLIPEAMVGRGVFGISLLLASSFLAAWHSLLWLYTGVRTPRSNALILGTSKLARELVAEIVKRPDLAIRVVGFVDDDPALVGTSIVNPTVIGLTSELPRLVSAHGIDRVVVGLQDRRGRLPIDALLHLKTRGIAIEDATTLYERVTGKIALEDLKPSWMIFNSGFNISRSVLIQKRLLSLLVSLILLIVFAPVMLLLMVLIKLDSRGPLFFRQERVGMDGRVFTLWKFRSMWAHAELDSGPVWASPDDPRITRIGRIMRRMRLDELPQLFNVLKGDMSMVGPRPERPHFVKELAEKIPFYHLRHAVKPGVTGWAQINYQYGGSFEDAVEKLQWDLFYVKHLSLPLDALIVLQTIKIVLFQRGY